MCHELVPYIFAFVNKAAVLGSKCIHTRRWSMGRIGPASMKTSIATVSVSGTLEAKLHSIASAGYAGAEIFENDLLSSELAPGDIGSLMRDLGLVCTMFQPFRDLEGLPEPQRAKAFDRLERKFDVMADLGTDMLLVCSSCSPLASGDRGQLVGDQVARRR